MNLRPTRSAAALLSLTLASGIAAAHGADSTPIAPGLVPGNGASVKKEAKVKAALVPVSGSVAPGGTGTLALTFEIAKGWHMYWDGRNDTGAPPTAEFKAPAGYAVGGPETWRWPAPERHVAPGDLLDHVYYGTLSILIPVKVPETAKPGDRVTIQASAEWLVCDESCIAENGELATTVTIGEKSTTPDDASSKSRTDANDRMPAPLAAEVRLTRTGDDVTISHPEADWIAFMPAHECVEISGLVTTGAAKGNRLVLPVISKDPRKDELSGMLEIRRAGKPGKIYSVRRTLRSIGSDAEAKNGPRSAP